LWPAASSPKFKERQNGILYRMHFYDAWNLVKEKVPISNIDLSHIAKLKELFKI
jgi:hypothetical protein